MTLVQWLRLPQILTFSLALLAMTAWAGCEIRPQHINYLREDLRRAAIEGDVPTALDFADRGRRELDQLALAAGRCGCTVAQQGFEATSRQLKKLALTEVRAELRAGVKAVQTGSEQAVSLWKACGAE